MEGNIAIWTVTYCAALLIKYSKLNIEIPNKYSNVGGNQGIKAKFLDWNAEL